MSIIPNIILFVLIIFNIGVPGDEKSYTYQQSVYYAICYGILILLFLSVIFISNEIDMVEVFATILLSMFPLMIMLYHIFNCGELHKKFIDRLR